MVVRAGGKSYFPARNFSYTLIYISVYIYAHFKGLANNTQRLRYVELNSSYIIDTDAKNTKVF